MTGPVDGVAQLGLRAQPLHDELAEQSALGGAMLSRNALWDVLEVVRPSDFSQPRHELIARAIGRLARAGAPVDVISACDELRRAGEIDRAGGDDYLHLLTSVVPTAANAGYYAGIVRTLRMRRGMVEAGLRLVDLGQGTEGDVLAQLEQARQEVDRVAHGVVSEPRPVGDGFAELVDELEQPAAHVATPWSDLNDLVGGLRPGGLYVVGARPAQGKTIVGLQLAVQLAQQAGAVAFASLEMSRSDLQRRLVAQFAGIPIGRLVDSALTARDWEAFARVRPTLERAPIYISDDPSMNLHQVRAFTRAVSRKTRLAGVVVDYLQLLESPDDDRRSRAEVVAGFSRGLKILARDLNVPVIALSQLNRSSVQRADGRPSMADLRESGAIEQDADVVMLLHRDERSARRRHLLDVHVAKNRRGATGKVELLWQGEYARVRTNEWSPTGSIPPELLDEG
jgi:replicative DNA helicase